MYRLYIQQRSVFVHGFSSLMILGTLVLLYNCCTTCNKKRKIISKQFDSIRGYVLILTRFNTYYSTSYAQWTVGNEW